MLYATAIIIKAMLGLGLMLAGIIVSMHTDENVLAVLIFFGGLISLWSILPSCSENRERDDRF
tara:strand:+ start:178 stop:366 length:189 start_codon:yes stop_codon:yes gene_type:complete